jgi:hypothetical protein
MYWPDTGYLSPDIPVFFSQGERFNPFSYVTKYIVVKQAQKNISNLPFFNGQVP